MPQAKDKKKYIRELAEILDETNLSEIEIEENGVRIRIARSLSAGQLVQTAPGPAPAAPVAVAAETSVAPPTSGNEGNHPGTLKSPMVGTVYIAPEPGAPPFVQVGDSVKEGQTVLIVEAMKVMNPIKAQKTGQVKEILITDSQPIEFDEALMIIE